MHAGCEWCNAIEANVKSIYTLAPSPVRLHHSRSTSCYPTCITSYRLPNSSEDWYWLVWTSSTARGGHLYAVYWSVCKICDWYKLCMIAQSFQLMVCLICSWSKWQPRLFSWSVDLGSLEVTLIPWSLYTKDNDHLMLFWSWLQTLQQVT